MQTILIIDDQPACVKTLELTLKKVGYYVLIASDGEEGLRLAQQEKPDLIFLDVLMPGMNGYQVCRELRQHPATKDTYIIILTAIGSELSPAEKQHIGANQYLKKPFSPVQIIKNVKQLMSSLEKKQPRSQTPSDADFSPENLASACQKT